MPDAQTLAAVDLGSNSFRLEIGSVERGQYVRQAYFKETVRQGGGFDAQSCLTQEAMQRGWDCLARFGAELRRVAPQRVQAVATQTLREAQNRDIFLATGAQLLGFPIEVITGDQEAALIYQGAAHTLANDDERRLVIDIGGRSTELILGYGTHMLYSASTAVGSVAWSTRYFAQGEFTTQAFANAEQAANAALADACRPLLSCRWDGAYGSAGTINAVVDVLSACGWPAGHVGRAGLDWLLDQLVRSGSAQRIDLPGLREDRRPIIGGGLSVLRGLFNLLAISQLEQCPGGLRQGLLVGMMAVNKKAR